MTDPERPDRTAAARWLVSCSPSRTLYAQREDGGQTVLVKVYESGSPAEAARELDAGRRLAGPGVAEHIDAEVDPETGKPCLFQEFVAGRDLQDLLDDDGPTPSRRAATLAHEVALVLARFAEHRDASAPRGFVHGDVKPSNVMVCEDGSSLRVVLLDLESARPAATSETESTGFTGGTHGFAPPEAYRGHAPTPAFDVFGLGATLHALISGFAPFGDPGAEAVIVERAVVEGRRRRWLLDGCPPPLGGIVARCLDPDPAARPSAREVADELGRWLDEASASPVDDARLLALRGHPLSALAALDGQGEPAWRARLRRLGRIVDALRVPGSPDQTTPIDHLALEIGPALRKLDAFLLRFPLHPTARAARRQASAAAARLPAELPEALASLKRAACHEEALTACDSAIAALRHVGRLPRRGGPEGLRPSAADRDPLIVLTMVRRDVVGAAERHARVEAQMRSATAASDIHALEAATDELAKLYGGASQVVAAAKDRLHRLEFYLARIGQQTASIDELEPFLEEFGIAADLTAIEPFRRPDGGRSTVRPRGLLRALHDLTEEFPALRERAEPAHTALSAALEAATRRAWTIVSEARHMLETPPIPIRPLTALMSRLDRAVQLDVLVDLAGRPRTDLQDRIESLRTKIEQARAERDRITRGAQKAMDRGHLTTAIYDMERAVDRFATEGGAEPGLAEQYEEAKRRKREQESALMRNHALAATYGELVQDTSSTPAERLVTLHEREHVLSFLCANLGAERTAPYVEDLRTVQIDLMREQAADGEQRMLTARSSEERLAIAQKTFDALQHEAPDSGWSPAEVREARALAQHWLEELEAATQTMRDAEHARTRAGRAARRRRLAVAVGVPSLLVATAAALLLLRGSQPVDHAAELRRALGEPVPLSVRTDEEPTFDGTVAVAKQREFVDGLRAAALTDVATDAARVAERVDAVARGAGGFQAVDDALAALMRKLPEVDDRAVRAAVETFERRARRAAFVLAVLRSPSPELRALLDVDTQLRRELSVDEADALRRALGG